MGQLTNLYVSESYQGLIKLTDSTTGVTGNLQYLQDGLGNRLPMQMSTSSVSITGSLYGTASYATQALSASWAPDNTDTGSYVTTSSFNAFTSSIDGRVDALEVATGSLQLQINQKLDTGSFNTYTSSQALYDIFLVDLIATKVDTGSFNSYTSSNDSKVNSLIASTGSYATTSSLTSLSQSIALTDLNQNNVIAGLATTSSLTNLSSSIASTDLAQNNRLTSIEGITGSLATTSSLTSLSQSIASTDLAQDNRLGSLETATGSLQNQINQKLDTGSFNSYTASMDARTGSYATTGSNVFQGLQTISGSLIVTGSITALSASITYLETVYQTSSVIFSSGSNILGDEAGDTQTLWGTVKLPSGPLVVTGSIHSTNIKGTGSLFLQPNQGDARYVEIYNTSPTDTHITASGGQIFLGDDQTYVKVDNYGSVKRIDIIADNGVYISSSLDITGSLNVTNGITGSLQGTASYATQALSASEASHTVSSSYANNATSASYSNNSTSASFAQTSISSSQADNAVSASEATHAVSSSYSNNSTSSSYSNNSTSSSYANNATSASFSQNTISGSFSNFAVSSSHSVNSDTSISSSYAQTASFASNGGVTQLLAGPNIIISPLSGKGQVTISSTGTGTGSFNTATGSYGSFYDTTTQINPVANTPNSMSFNETAITNGVAISGSISPFNTYIKTENAGIYNLQFSAQVDKTDGGTDSVDIWIRKNGTDLLDTATTVTLNNNNDASVAAWNWFVQSAANDYYQIIWASADTDMRLLAEVSSSVHPGIPSVIATANRIDQFLSNTGSFNGDFNGSFTGSLQGTASFASNALSSSYSNNSTSASFAQNALSASYAPTVLPSGLVSGSSQISYTGITDVPSGIISGSVQVSNLGFATTSSLSSYVLTSQTSSMSVATASYVLQAVSASFASNALSASYAPGVSIPAGTVSGSAQIVELGFAQTSSLSSYVLVSQTGSMSVATASYVLQAVSASYATNALTASFALNAVSTDTGSLMKTGSVAGNVLTFTKGDGTTFNLTVATGSGGGSAFPFTGSAIISGSLTVTGSINVSNGTNSGSVITNQTDDKTLPRVNNIVTLTSAEYNTMATASTLDANTLYVVSGSAAVSPFPYSGSIVVTGSIQGNVNALSIASNTASLNLNNGNFFTLQLVSGSATHINPSNIKPGQTINILLSTTGSGTVNFPSSVKQISGSSYVPTTTTSKDIITLVSFDSSSLYLANVKNLI